MAAPRVTSNSPRHIIFVLDTLSMAGKPEAKLSEAMAAMIEEMKLISQGTKPYFRLSFIVCGSGPCVLAEAQSEQAVDKRKVTAFSNSSRKADLAAALDTAADILRRTPSKRTDFVPYVFLLTDGLAHDEANTLAAAQALKDTELAAGNPRLVALGLGDGVDMAFLQKVATNAELARHVDNADEVTRLFPMIGTVVTSATGTEAIDQAVFDL